MLLNADVAKLKIPVNGVCSVEIRDEISPNVRDNDSRDGVKPGCWTNCKYELSLNHSLPFTQIKRLTDSMTSGGNNIANSASKRTISKAITTMTLNVRDNPLLQNLSTVGLNAVIKISAKKSNNARRRNWYKKYPANKIVTNHSIDLVSMTTDRNANGRCTSLV